MDPISRRHVWDIIEEAKHGIPPPQNLLPDPSICRNLFLSRARAFQVQVLLPKLNKGFKKMIFF